MENLQHELVLVVDFGAQYAQLIARRVRECGVYCEIIPYSYTINQIKAKNPKALIFSGGPNSVYAENTPSIDDGVFLLGYSYPRSLLWPSAHGKETGRRRCPCGFCW